MPPRDQNTYDTGDIRLGKRNKTEKKGRKQGINEPKKIDASSLPYVSVSNKHSAALLCYMLYM